MKKILVIGALAISFSAQAFAIGQSSGVGYLTIDQSNALDTNSGGVKGTSTVNYNANSGSSTLSTGN